MLKVLLVDDEPFILQGLKVLIDWNAEGYEVVGAVRTGQEAIDYLKENPVDLVMTDIKMPVMSGIELLEEVRRDQISDAYFIILSGYNDFAYAQQAVRYHCIDYILKPVEKEQLIAVLQKVAAMSEKKEIRRKDRQEMEAAYLARNLIACLNGKYDRKNLDYIRNHMQISEGVRYVDIELFTPGDDCEDGVAREKQRELYGACCEWLSEDGNHAVFDVSHDEKSYDIGFIYCDYMASKSEMTQEVYMQAFQSYLSAIMQCPIQMLVGKRVQDISAISKSYSTACILKSIIAFHPKKDIYYYEKEAQVNESGIVLCKNCLDTLIGAIEKNEKIQIRKSVDGLYEEIGRLGRAGDCVSLNINYLLFQLIHLASEQDNEVNQEQILQFISESSFEEGIMRGSCIHLSRFCCEYADYLAQLRRQVSRGVLVEIEKEIRENYADKLSLRELSKKYFVNRSYLGQIFRKQYGQSFKDYLSNYRINEAAKQLLKTDKRISQIAEDVGYKDNDYFIRKFIEIKGCTPSKFRKNSRNE